MGFIKKQNAVMNIEEFGIIVDFVNHIGTEDRLTMRKALTRTQVAVDILPDEAEVCVDRTGTGKGQSLKALEDQGVTLTRPRNAHKSLNHRPPRRKVISRQTAMRP